MKWKRLIGLVSEIFSIKVADRQTDTSTDNKGRLKLAVREPKLSTVGIRSSGNFGRCRECVADCLKHRWTVYFTVVNSFDIVLVLNNVKQSP